jgi:hypothetical protein
MTTAEKKEKKDLNLEMEASTDGHKKHEIGKY